MMKCVHVADIFTVDVLLLKQFEPVCIDRRWRAKQAVFITIQIITTNINSKVERFAKY